MVKQNGMTPDQISGTFKKLTDARLHDLKQSGTADILGHLSRSIRMLQDAGIDISLDIRLGQYSNAYDMVFGELNAQKALIAAYGFVKTGGTSRLLAIVQRIDDKPVQKVLLSDHNTHESESRMSWSSANKSAATAFHFDEDENALSSLQTAFLSLAANAYAVEHFDVAEAFGKNAGKTPTVALKGKPALKTVKP